MNKQDAAIKHHSDMIRILNESRNTKSLPDGISPALLHTNLVTAIHQEEPVNTIMETATAIQGNYYDDDGDEDDGIIFKSGKIESKVGSSVGKPILTEETSIPRRTGK